ncbi:MAG TPA: hypothetical protein VK787_08045 [Puia sp.]|nr:hypothetical protein [Puia sp.]
MLIILACKIWFFIPIKKTILNSDDNFIKQVTISVIINSQLVINNFSTIPASVRTSTSLRRITFIGIAPIERWVYNRQFPKHKLLTEILETALYF